MKNNFLLFLLFLTALPLFSQDDRVAQTNISISEVERIVMPVLDNEALLEEELSARQPGRAPRFAESFEVSISPATHGTWEDIDNETSVWRLRIHSAEAKSLNLGFSKYFMPEGGSLILYSSDFKRIRGPFTPADNEEHEELWTPIVEGDDLVIEVQIPIENRDALQLQLKTINHDFLGFGNPSEILSGSCNLDVICGEVDGWGIVDDYRDIIQSVAVISTGGGTFCTGFLVNNARQDCTPYFMTADHCGITASAAASLVTYWNFQNSTCREPGSAASGGNGDGNLDDFNTGSILRATWAPSDMTIVEMDDPISTTANAFFAGWDATDAIAQSVIGIHHPSTDEKRISFENDPTNIGVWPGAGEVPDGDHVIVQDWDIGTTEGGSSGSPLFNAEKRVVGQLHGGGAACGNNDYDSYGWFHSSWEGGGTPATRLKDWLDPDNTGTLVLDGRAEMQCNFFVDAAPASQTICSETTVSFDLEVSGNFTGLVSLSLFDLPAGVTQSFSNNPVNPGETSVLTLTNTETLAEGVYTITLVGTDGTEVYQGALTLNVFTAVPETTLLTVPANMALEVSPAPAFEWSTEGASSYEFELASDIAFTTIISSATDLNEASYFAQGLETETLYYWRVRASNFCGINDWSEPFEFTTGSCSFDVSADIPVGIPTNVATVTSSIDINYNGIITDLDVVDIIGTHSWLSDLTFSLTSPSGTTVVLVTEACDDLDNFNITFDDQAESGAFPCPYLDGNAYQPEGSLADFNGEDVFGTWTLIVEDGANFDGGSLNGWSLQVCTSETLNISVVASPATISLCVADEGTYDIVVGPDFEGEVTVSASSSPMGVPVSFEVNTTEPGGTVTATVSNLVAVTPGSYTLTFTATDGSNINTATTTLEVEGAPQIASLNMPANNTVDEVFMPSFSWTAIPGVSEYFIEIATDEDFATIINSANVATTMFNQTTDLAEETTYYWRVSATNDCGTSQSVTHNFTTEMISGINDLEGVSVLLSPNPTNGLVNIQFGQALETDVILEVYGLNGQLMQRRQLLHGATLTTLNLGTYADGIYLVKLKSAADILVRRVAVQN